MDMETKRELRIFGIGLTGFLWLVGSLLFYKGNRAAWWSFFFVGGGTLLVAFVRPILLAHIQKIMARLARSVGRVNTMALLSVIFYGVFTPLAFIFRLSRRDSLERTWDKGISSYWHKSDRLEFEKERYEKQF